ncbi:Endochitinase 1 [Podila clonocystis]|nr:Endochitinase 1 [Podila clonocystis]
MLGHAQRLIGYYSRTAADCKDRPDFTPKNLPTDLYTHLNFGFASINNQGVIQQTFPDDHWTYQELNELKLKKPSLRTAITIGGWDMDMAEYSKMVSTPANREKFILSAMKFVREHKFDGIDFDWEYPSDNRRGGQVNDPQNFVTFMKEMRDAANAEELQGNQERLILSIALPGGPFHGNYFLVPQLAQYVNWFNIMAYNLHGQWEKMVFCAAPLNDPALNTAYYGYSLVDAVQSMAPRSVDPKKFNLGLSMSGVTFTLGDQSKTHPGAPANGPGKAGCQENGAMAFFEAQKLANNFGITNAKDMQPDAWNRKVTQAPQMDELSKCMYMVVDNDQWVGYDTPETFAYKVKYLKDYGFGGVSVWSMDSDSANHDLARSIKHNLVEGYAQDSPDFPKESNRNEKVVDSSANGGDTSERKESVQKKKATSGALDCIHRLANGLASVVVLGISAVLLI